MNLENRGCACMDVVTRSTSMLIPRLGHPAGKWVPLEYSNGIRTDMPHDCPKKHNGSGQLLSNSASAIAMTTDNLAIIKQIAAALNEYIAIKEGMAAAASTTLESY